MFGGCPRSFANDEIPSQSHPGAEARSNFKSGSAQDKRHMSLDIWISSSHGVMTSMMTWHCANLPALILMMVASASLSNAIVPPNTLGAGCEEFAAMRASDRRAT
ncbi:unnamed protein product [Prorocentrum cordatum]|uniref:Uncharacterized protein n=1 Tax=Prorocentrum cordatum TaxID=2364126 RepID=A0ABN9SP53_9DINO|nr:unnamed protein product [Polarella glacialis]